MPGHVHILAHAPARSANAQRQIIAAADDGNVTHGLGALDDLGSVRAFAREFSTGMNVSTY